jgi:hypothetical protein
MEDQLAKNIIRAAGKMYNAAVALCFNGGLKSKEVFNGYSRFIR